MIVGCHFATHGGFQFDSQTITIPRLWWNVIEMGGHFGVDVFILITGYFLIDGLGLSIKPQKIIKFWGQIVFYSVALFFFAFVIGKGDPSIKNIVKSILPITFSQWWFASSYFILYLIHPFINRLLHSFSKKEYQIFLLTLLFLWCIIPTFTTSPFKSNSLIEFVMYYSIAGYIKIYGIHQKIESKNWFLLWLLFSTITYLTCVAFMMLGTKYQFFYQHTIYFYSRNSILTIARAITFFMMFQTMKIKYSSFINKISAATFGVYLLHDSKLLRIYFWKDVFKNANYQDSIMLIPYSIAVVILVYVICTVIDLVRQKVFEKPFVQLVNMCHDSFSKKFEKIIGAYKVIVFGNDKG